ncbi:AraC family transcriptional regulator [Olsenella massiliensis]|uniref:AraC family transcriptional regulator n=1 Tax=Olsenella massiliensis TaxID=1622075 RepID=UPI0009EA10F0|nr:AraC family transcriptional regulator [Olsenella massiliensis]
MAADGFDEYSQYQETRLHEQPGFPYDTYLCTIPLDFERVAPHWHEQMEVIYVKRGSGVVSVDFESHPVQAGSIVVVTPGQIHAIDGARGQRMEYENIIFSLSMLGGGPNDAWFAENVVAPLRAGTIRLPCPLIERSPLEAEARAALDAADRACETCAPGYSLVVKSELLLLLRAIYLHGGAASPRPRRASADRMRAVLELVRERYGERLTVEDAAKVAGYSKAHLMRSFRHETGQSFVSYLTEYRLTAASHLLRRSEEPVSVIAARCGFESLSYFIRRFKGRFGISPGAYRRHGADGRDAGDTAGVDRSLSSISITSMR